MSSLSITPIRIAASLFLSPLFSIFSCLVIRYKREIRKSSALLYGAFMPGLAGCYAIACIQVWLCQTYLGGATIKASRIHYLTGLVVSELVVAAVLAVFVQGKDKRS